MNMPVQQMDIHNLTMRNMQISKATLMIYFTLFVLSGNRYHRIAYGTGMTSIVCQEPRVRSKFSRNSNW